MDRFKLDDALAFRELDGEIFAITPDDGRFHVISDEADESAGAVSRLLIELLREPRTIEHLVEAVCAEFDVDDEAAAHDVSQFLAHLERERIVVRVS
ncbi:MAG: PqqD family protein [Myxococcales bacterium]|nr:PqqD family protein [Myxococcales bacterium]